MRAKRSTLYTILSLGAFLLVAAPVSGAPEEGQASVFQEADAGKAQTSTDDVYARNLKRWQSLSERERQAIRERARALGPDGVRALRTKDARFRSMSPDDRERIRTNYEKFNRFPVREREALRERHRRFEEMPSAERETYRRRFGHRGAGVPAGHGDDRLPDTAGHGGRHGPMGDSGDRDRRGPAPDRQVDQRGAMSDRSEHVGRGDQRHPNGDRQQSRPVGERPGRMQRDAEKGSGRVSDAPSRRMEQRRGGEGPGMERERRGPDDHRRREMRSERGQKGPAGAAGGKAPTRGQGRKPGQRQ